MVEQEEGGSGVGAPGVGTDHGVPEEGVRARQLGEDSVGVGDVAGGGEGEEGDELADDEGVVGEGVAEEVGVGLLAF